MNDRTHRPLSLPAFGFSFVAFGVVLSGVFALFSGCGLQTNGLANPNADGGADSPTIACQSAAQCDDGDPCTTDTCSTQGICTFTPVPDGDAPASSQMKGTCQKLVCKGGEASSVEDDTNVPTATDMCVTASCQSGKPVMTLSMAGTPCTLSGAPGVCMGGACKVACKSAADCPSMGPCQTASCDGSKGLCVYANVSDGTPTPGVPQTSGDCHTHICLAGMDTNAVDDSDLPPVPAAMAGCADAKCSNGTPSFPLHAVDSMCKTWMGTSAGFCDAAGTCVQCTTDNECPGYSTRTDCLYPTCTSGTCVTTKPPSGTATTTNPPQVPGDCQKIECDGNGSTMMVADDTDTPPAIGGGCQPGTCNAGVPGHGMSANGSTCGTNLACLNGQCSGCTKDMQCQPPPYDTCGGGGMPNVCGCTPKTCASLGLTCGANINDACGGVLNCNDGKQDGTETDSDCGGNAATCATRCGQGKKCGVDGDCQAGLTCTDGVCCNQACKGSCQACTLAKNGQTTGSDGQCQPVVAGKNDPRGVCMMQNVSTCGDTGTTCNGAGACATYAVGTICVAASCVGNTLTNAEKCTAPNTCTVPVPATQDCTPYKCGGSPAACTTSCNVDTDCATSAYYCNAAHQCVTRLTKGTSCTATSQCQASLTCVGPAGNQVCCDSACTGKCRSCLGALTGGANGTCANVSAGVTDPTATCAVTGSTTCGTDGTCDGSGNCRDWPAGTTCNNLASCMGSTQTIYTQCNGTGACLSGKTTPACPNGLMCNAGMTGCLGGCTFDTDCVSTDYCSGGMCVPKIATGSTSCNADNQCLSNHCGTVNHTCCMSTCTPSGGACGIVNACDGTGACMKAAAGTTCSAQTCPTGGNTLTNFTQCDGNGGCTQGASSGGTCPNFFTCDSTGMMCNTSCNVSNQSTNCTTKACAVAMGVCTQITAGNPCSNNLNCVSGLCLGNTCCNTNCVHTDPSCQASCQPGSGACVYPPALTSCSGGPTCSLPNMVGGNVCDGLGTCQAISLTCSGANVCTTGLCMTCSVDADCTAYGWCNGTMCAPKGQTGDSCTMGNGAQCLSGTCTGGHCT